MDLVRDWRHSPIALALAVIAVYAGTLHAGWLGYDDDWLVRANELLATADPAILGRVFSAFDRDTRILLGAEYLPMRDLVVWLARGVLGFEPLGLRVLQLGIYLGAVLCLQRWTRIALPPAATLAVWLFALHPVHAESVAWLAGTKDLLALLFTSAALLAYASSTPRVQLLAILFVALACLSKSAAVITPLLLLVYDAWAGRRPDGRVIVSSLAIACCCAVLHAWVGSVVGMYAPPLGSSRLDGVLAMALVVVRYLGIALLVHPSSLFYEVSAPGPSLATLGSVALLITLFAIAIVAWRRGLRWPFAALAVFVIALLPVSQVLAPLQNRMADRYLVVAVFGPMVAVAFLLEGALTRVRSALGGVTRGAVLAIVGSLGLVRALTFADPIALFREGTERTEHNAVAPFMLAEAYVRMERLEEAEGAYRIALSRDRLRTDRGRRAGNNLARLLAAQGRSSEALDIYRTLVDRYPDDPRVLHNLSVIEARLGDAESAARHRAALETRFPEYVPGRDRPGPL